MSTTLTRVGARLLVAPLATSVLLLAPAQTTNAAPAAPTSAASTASVAASQPAVAQRQTRAYQAGHERGLIEGRQAGKEDKEGPKMWDLEGQRELLRDHLLNLAPL